MPSRAPCPVRRPWTWGCLTSTCADDPAGRAGGDHTSHRLAGRGGLSGECHPGRRARCAGRGRGDASLAPALTTLPDVLAVTTHLTDLLAAVASAVNAIQGAVPGAPAVDVGMPH